MVEAHDFVEVARLDRLSLRDGLGGAVKWQEPHCVTTVVRYFATFQWSVRSSSNLMSANELWPQT